jgi:hypothetical protein
MLPNLGKHGLALGRLLGCGWSKEGSAVDRRLTIRTAVVRKQLREGWIIRRGCLAPARRLGTTWRAGCAVSLWDRTHHGDRFSALLQGVRLAALTHGFRKPL